MGITVQEALKLKGFEQARIIAGQAGLSRVINRVSVLECPEKPEYPELTREGDFLLTAFFAAKDDWKMQLSTIKRLIHNNSSGLCIIDLYLQDLAPEIKLFADQAQFPVIMLPNEIPYAEIITNVMDAIIQRKDDTIHEIRLENLLVYGKSENDVREMALALNPDFKENVMAVYCKVNNGHLPELAAEWKRWCQSHPHCIAVKFRQGVLLIVSFSGDKKKDVNLLTKELIKNIQPNPEVKAGVSNLHKGLQYLNLCLKEALLAADAGSKISDQNITYYAELGLYKPLMLLRNQPELKEFHDEIMGPILKYDEKYRSKLLQTAIAFVENEGDMKKTAHSLFQHVNTIRYRIDKIREILGMEHLGNSFYEQLAVAVKIHKIL